MAFQRYRLLLQRGCSLAAFWSSLHCPMSLHVKVRIQPCWVRSALSKYKFVPETITPKFTSWLTVGVQALAHAKLTLYLGTSKQVCLGQALLICFLDCDHSGHGSRTVCPNSTPSSRIIANAECALRHAIESLHLDHAFWSLADATALAMTILGPRRA